MLMNLVGREFEFGRYNIEQAENQAEYPQDSSNRFSILIKNRTSRVVFVASGVFLFIHTNFCEQIWPAVFPLFIHAPKTACNITLYSFSL